MALVPASNLSRKHSARHAAFELLKAVHHDGAYANIVWPRILRHSGLDEQDRRFATELAYGALRMGGQLEAVLERAGGKKMSSVEAPIRWVLVLGAYQLLYLSTPHHAAVSESVILISEVGKSRAKGLVNAILRRVSEKSPDEWLDQLSSLTDNDDAKLGARYAHPTWVVTKLRAALRREGAASELDSLLSAHNVPARVTATILPGLADINPEDQRTPYSPLGVYLSGDPRNDSRIAAGTARIQDEGSQLAALVASRALSLSPGDRVLDACSGPGGKTAVLAADASRAQASVVATEIQPHRAKLVKESVSALPGGVVSVHATGVSEFLEEGGPFERILLDAPCLGLGALRRRPEARWSKSIDDLAELNHTQHTLLDHCLDALGPGGELVYVTCSPVVEETTDVISQALERHPDVDALDTASLVNSVARVPLADIAVGTAVQLWPHRHNTDGMFIQALKKRDDSLDT